MLKGDPFSTPPGSAMKPLTPGQTPADAAMITAFEKLDRECPALFVRMAGMNLFQRSVLTVNNGRYYVDTTRSEEYQRKSPDLSPTGPRFVNVFGQGKTYYMFFLFAKTQTKQTYQIYGGPDFTASNVTGIKVDASVLPLPPGAVTPWTKAPWTVTNDARKGVVNVEVDFNKVDPKEVNLDPAHLNPDKDFMDETCQPHTYCMKTNSGANTTCGCDETRLGVLGLLSPGYKKVCKNICEHWAVKDLDCPKGGCLGFQFTLSSGFEAKNQLERPGPMAYPPADWNSIALLRTLTSPDKSQNTGGCFYSDKQTPSDHAESSCKVAD